MLDAIRKHTQGWLAKAILAIITIPFALFGIDSYLNQAGSNVAVATVAGEKISVQEFSNSIENVRNRLQSEGQKLMRHFWRALNLSNPYWMAWSQDV